MATDEYITHSAEETVALGGKLAPTLKSARMVILRGNLGAGKTTLVKGIAKAFRRHRRTKSPARPSPSSMNSAALRSICSTSISIA